MEVVYTFHYDSPNGYRVRVNFLSNNLLSGADHSCSHQIRRNWAESLPISQTWAKLSDHQYLDFLTNNDLIYTVYKTSISGATKTIFVK